MIARVMIGLMVPAAACGQAPTPPGPEVPRARCETQTDESCICKTPGVDRRGFSVHEKDELDFSGVRESVSSNRSLVLGHERLDFGVVGNHLSLRFGEPLGALAEISVGWRQGIVGAQLGAHTTISANIERRGRFASWYSSLLPATSGTGVVLSTSFFEEPREDWDHSRAITQKLQPLPLCRCDEAEDIVRDIEGRLTASRCRKEGATRPRLQVDYDPRGLPLRIEELRGDKPPVTVPPTLTSLPGPRAHAPVPARTRTVVMRWSADGWLEHVHVELDGRRYGMAVDLGPTSIRLGSYFDDVRVGIWIETDADGLPARAVDHGPAGKQALPIPIVKRAI